VFEPTIPHLDRPALLDALGRRSALTAVLLIDVDRFGHVNATIGDDAGDELLATIGRRITTCARTCDAIARLHADRFAVVVSTPEQPGVIAERVRRALAEPLHPALRVTASIGLARSIAPTHPAALLRSAEEALHEAKGLGGDVVVAIDVVPDTAVDRLRDAIDTGALVVEYQPVVCLDTGRVVGGEALVRWLDDELGLLPPDWFVPAAARSGLIVRLGANVAEQAIHAVAHVQHDLGRPDLVCTLNIHGHELHDLELGHRMASIAADAGLANGTLHVEVTERDLGPGVASRLAQLRDAGLTVGIDDLGSGPGAFRMLGRLPIDVVKADMRATMATTAVLRPTTFYAVVADLAHALGASVIGEGVEHETDLRGVVAMGGNTAQGALFAPAASLDTFVETIERSPFWWRFASER
jgi:diguanylate cyclase (GGDEF)-like protein